MNVRAADLEQVLQERGVRERTYAVLVTDVGRGTQINVVVEARADVVAGTIARSVFYETHGRPMTAIHTRTVVIEDDIDISPWARPSYDNHLRMGV